MSTEAPALPIDHDAPPYRCCCSWIQVKRGTYLIGYFSAFLIIANFSLKAAGYTDTAWNWELLFLVVDSLAVTSLIYGVYAERAAFLQPFVVLSIVTVMFFVLLTAFFFSAIVDSGSYAAEHVEVEMGERAQVYAAFFSVKQNHVVPLVAAAAVLLTSTVVVLHCWFIRVVFQCALYFRDLEPIKVFYAAKQLTYQESLHGGYSAQVLAEEAVTNDASPRAATDETP